MNNNIFLPLFKTCTLSTDKISNLSSNEISLHSSCQYKTDSTSDGKKETSSNKNHNRSLDENIDNNTCEENSFISEKQRSDLLTFIKKVETLYKETSLDSDTQDYMFVLIDKVRNLTITQGKSKKEF